MNAPLRKLSRLVLRRSLRVAQTLPGLPMSVAHEHLWRAAVDQIRLDGALRLPRVRVALTNAEFVLVESWEDK